MRALAARTILLVVGGLVAAARAEGPGSSHPEMARLAPGTSYLRLVAVGAQRHHFAIWFAGPSPGVCEVAAARSDRGPLVEVTGCASGPSAAPPGAPLPPLASLPPPVAALGALAWRQLRARRPTAEAPRILYRGAYREVTVHELVPSAPSVAAGLHVEARLGADERLGRFTHALGYRFGRGAVTWTGPPRWIPHPPGALPARGLLAPLYDRVEDRVSDGDPLAEAILAEARREQAGLPRRTLEEIAR